MSATSKFDPVVYQALHTGAFGDRHFYISLIENLKHEKSTSLSVLELGCGSGRILIDLALSGAHVTGLDLSETSLDLCRQQVATTSKSDPSLESRIRLVCADFRELSLLPNPPLKERYDLVLITYNSLYCLSSEADQVRLIKDALSLLKPTGTLWIDGYALPDPEVYHYESDPAFSPLTVLSLPPREDGSPRELGVEERDQFDLAEQRLTVSYRYSAPAQEAHLEPLHQRIEEVEHRYIYPWQLPNLCSLAGGTLNTLSADFGGELLDLSGELRQFEWGIEAEHWVASLRPINP